MVKAVSSKLGMAFLVNGYFAQIWLRLYLNLEE